MALYLLRHGQTDMNLERRMQGHADIELNEEGENQARLVREEIEKLGISFDKVYSSGLKRALKTACLATGLSEDRIEIRDELIEICFGPYELHARDSLPLEIEEAIFLKPGITPIPEGVESFPHLMKRAGDFVNRIRKEHLPEEDILVVSHGSLIHSVIMNTFGTPIEEFWESFRIKNCCLLKDNLDREDLSFKRDKIETVFPGFSLKRKAN